MDTNNESLDQIGKRYGTDKATYHNFCNFYDSHFNSLKNENISLLEIGIYNGSSLRMWKDYFENGEIYGVDIVPKNFNEDRIKTEICDQNKREDLEKIFSGKEFDIIVDDGGHMMNQQQLSFGVLFKTLKSGGLYVIEDLHTSHSEGYRRNLPFEISTLYVLNNFIENGVFNSSFLTEEENNYLTSSIKSIELLDNNNHLSITSIIFKK